MNLLPHYVNRHCEFSNFFRCLCRVVVLSRAIRNIHQVEHSQTPIHLLAKSVYHRPFRQRHVSEFQKPSLIACALFMISGEEKGIVFGLFMNS